ncbi:hypothetical protein IFR05_016962, partial [Cadophora sp. M221]
MASRRSLQVQPDYGYGRPVPIPPIGTMGASRSNPYPEVAQTGYDNPYYPASSASYTPATSSYSPTGPIASIPAGASLVRSDYSSNGYNMGASSALYGAAGPGYNSYSSPNSSWEPQGRISPETYEEFV